MPLPVLKEKVYLACLKHVQDRIDTAIQAIESAQEAGENDTKSSAGDKYETGREMMKQEIERHQQLLADAKQMQFQLQELVLAPDQSLKIMKGSLIETSRGMFYMAVGIGKIHIDNQEIFVLSPSAPVGQRLLGKKKDEEVIFNNYTFKILGVY